MQVLAATHLSSTTILWRPSGGIVCLSQRKHPSTTIASFRSVWVRPSHSYDKPTKNLDFVDSYRLAECNEVVLDLNRKMLT